MRNIFVPYIVKVSNVHFQISNIYSPDSQAEKSSIIKTTSLENVLSSKSYYNNAENFDHINTFCQSNNLAFNRQNDVHGESPQLSSSSILTSTPVIKTKVFDELENENLYPRLRIKNSEIEQLSNLVSDDLITPIHKAYVTYQNLEPKTGCKIQTDHNNSSNYECDNSSPISMALKNVNNHQVILLLW